MKKLDENGYPVEAKEELFCTSFARELVAFLRSGFPVMEVEQTNMQSGLLPFIYTVLVNCDPKRLGDARSYLQCRDALPQMAQDAGLKVQGLLLLDEGSGHEYYLAQPRSAQSSAFGRMPILVWTEYKTGTVLCENSDALARHLQEFAAASSPTGDGVV